MKTLGLSPVRELGLPFWNLAQEISSTQEPLRQSLSQFLTTCTGAIEQCLEEGKLTGIFRQTLPSKQPCQFVFAQIQGSLLLRKTQKEPEVIERNLEMVRGGLLPGRGTLPLPVDKGDE